MTKINDYSLALLPQEVADLLDDTRSLLNFGKYQIPITTSYPGWNGRLGEFCIYAGAATWALMICTSDKTTRWAAMSNFYP